MTKAKLVFFGNERLSTGLTTDAPTLKALLAEGYEIAAVVAHHGSARSRKARELEIEAVAKQHDIPVLTPSRPTDIKHELIAMHAQAGILVAYGRIIPQSVIDIFPSGIINIHPSLLPKYRGPIPIEEVILDGAPQTGVSIMQLTDQMDAGPVYAQQTVRLTGSESKADLASTLLNKGGKLLIKSLPGILRGSLQPTPQDESQATSCNLITKADGQVDWNKPAIELEREVRAYLGWPGSHVKLFDRDVLITQAHVTEEAGPAGQVAEFKKQLKVYCSEDALIIDKLKPAGKGEMSGQAFLAGIK